MLNYEAFSKTTSTVLPELDLCSAIKDTKTRQLNYQEVGLYLILTREWKKQSLLSQELGRE